MTIPAVRRPIRIGAISGAVGDRVDGMERMAAAGNVDLLYGDYLAEVNLATKALEIALDPTKGFESIFLYQLERSLDDIVKNRLKLVCNAGALNVKGLALATQGIVRKHGANLKIAYVTGDDLLPRFDELQKQGETFQHLEGGDNFASSWPQKPVSVNAYIGAAGIVEAFNGGADIILTGRVTDASPIIAASIWWHGWKMDNYDALAGALLAGHCIECGSYVTGGNYCRFTEILERHYDLPFPIAEIASDGSFVVTKHEGTTGLVSVDTVKCQILYEIQGTYYLNPDVQARLTGIKVEPDGLNRVRVSGLVGLPPPSTTKVAIFAVAGYQAEAMMFATGLNVAEKFKVWKDAAEKLVGQKVINQFTTWSFVQYGVPAPDARNQAEATACYRIFCQAPTLEAFGPQKNLVALLFREGLGHYPGFHFIMDHRTWTPIPYSEYFPARVGVDKIHIETHFLDSGKTVAIQPPAVTIPYQKQEDHDYTGAYDPSSNGPTVRASLGSIVLGRSGDKGGNANVGLFVRNADEYEWLRATMSKETMLKFLEHEEYTRVERVELPTILAVHFVVHDILGKGVSSTSRADNLGKSFGEYIRWKEVDIPVKFVERGLA